MKRRRDGSKPDRKRARKRFDTYFRRLSYQSLEARLFLHADDDSTNWLDHFNDDQADQQYLNSAPAADVAQTADAAPAQSGTPAQIGQWGPLMQWPVEFINALMLPTGKVMGWDRLMNLRLWDPNTGQITIPTSPGYNIFCTGMSLLADGEVLVSGGHVDNLTGLPFASIYNPFTDTWKPLPNMNAGRWYPSSTTLANGDVLILSGQTNDTGIDDPLPQVFDVTTMSWIDLDNALQSLPLYPRTFDAPNGDVFVAGPQQLSEYLSVTGGGQWIPVANRIQPDRTYGSAVMYAPGKVLYVGGGEPASNSAEIIDLNAANPQWVSVSPMAFARRNCNATLLPDGEVLVTGGNTGSSNYDGDPSLAAEIWNPTTQTFRTVASESDIRWYHSTALLLPNGQILSGSGDNHLTEQVYSPPYLFEGAQPTITSAPGTVMYGDNFFVGTPDAATITGVTWIRLGTATHAENWDQYIQQATFTQTTGGLMVTAPPTPNTAPPGYYMLFIMRGDVPSVAKFVQVSLVQPSLTTSNISVTEPANGSNTTATFTVTLPLTTDHPVTVNYATANITATAGLDYTATSGTLTFAPGVASQTVTVTILGDAANEANETFALNLTSPTGAVLAQTQALGLIRDHNALPVIQIQGTTMQEGNSGTTNANFVVTLSSAQSGTVTMAYTTMDGTALAGQNYIAKSGTVTFAPGVTQQTISVAVIGDTIPQDHHWFFVNLSNPVGATLDIAQAKAFIYDDDDAPAVSLQPYATIAEPTGGGTANLVLTVSLSGPSYKTVTVGWQTLANGTAIDGKNYIGQFGGITFPPLVTTQTITIPILDDGVNTPDLTFSVQLQASLVNGTYGASSSGITITNSDLLPGITLLNSSLSEGNSGTASMTFTATLSNAVNQTVTVNYTTSAGSATSGTDYTPTTGTLTIPANTTSGTFTVPIKGDTTLESNETFNVTLSNPVGAQILVGKATGTIVDDDSALVPATPTLTGTAAFGSAVLAWQAVTGATTYNVYRSTTLNGEGTTPLVTGITGTGYTDNGLTNGTVYYYRMTAVTTQAGKSYEGSVSNEVSVIPTSYSFPYFFTQQSYNFSTFTTAQSHLLSLNGDNVENMGLYGYNLQLTDGGTNQTDSAFTLNPVNISRFTTQFTFEQDKSFNWNDPTGGGMTFTIQNVGPTAVGGVGSGLGYAGINNSVAVKFDLLDNSGEGPNSTGLYTNGALPTSANSINLTGTGIDLHSGDPFAVGMTYDGTMLLVTITDTVTHAQATQSYTVNIPSIVGGNMAYVGFTAGTENHVAVQTIDSWTLTPAPTAPTNLQAALSNGTVVNLSWTNNDPNATGVVIERKTGVNGAYAQIAAVNLPTATTYIDNSAAPNVTYYYRIRSNNNGSTSVASNEVNVTTTTGTVQADLQVTVSDGKTSIVAGTANTYTIVVTNAGPATVTGATISDTLLPSATWTATATGGASGFWASAGGNIANTVTMPSGSTITYIVSTYVSVATTGTTANTATITAPAGVTDTNPTNNTATDTDTVTQPVNPQGDLQVTVTDGQTSVAAGAAVTYTIVVTNAGPNTVVGATIADTFPAAATWTAAATNDASGFVLNSTGSIASTVTMPPGSTITYVVSTSVPVGATGNFSNTPTITAPAGFTDPNLANNTATDTDTVTTSSNPPADLQVTISDGQTVTVPGTFVTYTIVVTNAGPNTATGAVITAAFPAAATWTGTGNGGASGFWGAAFGSINNTVTMPPSSTITYVVKTLVPVTATGSLSSTASVTAPANISDPIASNNTATDTDTLTPPPADPQSDLQITITDGQASTLPGAALTYTIVATNVGTNTVVGATIADAMPTGLTGVAWTATGSGDASGFWGSSSGDINNIVTMPPGSTITYTVTGTVGAAATGTLANTASITPPAGATDPNTANNTATDSDPIGLPADLQVTITDGKTSATPGAALTYTIVVTNAGPNAVTGATIADTLPATLTAATYTATTAGGATGFTANGSGNIANTVTMPVGSTITYIVTATLSAAATGSVGNTTTVTAPAGIFETNTANNSATDTDAIGPQADLRITVTDGQASAIPGAALTYTIVVTNAGPSSVTGATIADTLPATLTGATYTATTAGAATGFTASGSGNIADTVTMPAGSTITYIVTATLSGAATGTVANTATVAVPAGTTDPNAANNSATDTDTIGPQADLQITVTDGQTGAVPGMALTYTIVVTNAGPSIATGATVADTLPATLTGASYTATTIGGATGFTASGSGNISNTVTMPSGSTITYVVTGTLSAAATGSVANTATVTAPSGTTDPNAANNSATDTDTIGSQADLQITVTDGKTSAVPGTALTYTIVVTNAGPSNVTGATVADSLPAALTGATFTATATGGATGFTASGSGNIANTVTMPSGSTITYVVTGMLSAAATGSLANTATVGAPAGTTDPTAANNSATDTDTLTPQADLQITVTDGQASAVPGAAITYTIVVTNAGPSNVTGATIADTLPATLTGVTYTATTTGGATGFTASGSGNIANTVTMPAGSTITYVVKATVSAAATGSLGNTATVTVPAGTTDPTAANNSATDTDTLAPQADLQVTITDGQTSTTAGAAVTYTIVVTNAGPSNVTGATVTDSLPATLTGATYTATSTGGATGFTASGSGNIANTVTMPAGSTITYVVKATVSSGATGSLANTATVAVPAGTTDPTAANNSATDTDTLGGTPADLQVTVTDGQTTAAQGTSVTYTIVVTNAGTSTVTGATIVDTLPAVYSGIGFTATATGGASGFWASASVNLNNTVTMPAGSTITYLLHGVLSNTATGTVANTATVAVPAGYTDTNAANNTATDNDTATAPTSPKADLQVTVTDGQTTLVPGAIATYTVVVTNAGPNTATGATIVDTLPTTFSNISFTATATGDASGFWGSFAGNLNNTVTMPPGSAITYVLKGTLATTATGTVSNTATVTAPSGVTDPTTTNNTATDADTVVVGIASTSPASGATGVSRSAAITVTFSAAMNASTINTTNFVVLNSSGQQIAGTVTYNATTKTATFTPSVALSASSNYTIRIVGGSSGVKDANGNILPATFNSTFTTGTT